MNNAGKKREKDKKKRKKWKRKDRFRSWNPDLPASGGRLSRKIGGERFFRVVGHAAWHAAGCNDAQVPLKRQPTRRHSPPEAGGSSHAPPTSRSRVPTAQTLSTLSRRNELACLSLNTNLQPGPRSTRFAIYSPRKLYRAIRSSLAIT